MPKILQSPMVNAVRAALAGQAGPRMYGAPLRLAAGGLVLSSASLIAASAGAAGLGDIRVQSALGEPLRASVGLLGDDAGSKLGTCFSAKLNTADGAFIVAPRIALSSAGAGGMLMLSTTMALAEPVVTLVVEMGCGDAIRKEFSLLLDPPMYQPASVPADASAARPAARSRQGASVAADTGARNRMPGMADAATNAAVPGATSDRRASVSSAPGSGAPTRAAARTRPAASKPPAVSADTGSTQRLPARPNVATAATPPKNVLRLSARDGSDADLVNAIGLRLALANRLAEEGAARADASGNAGGTAIPDLAKSAADRAARARFAAALRDQPEGAAGADANLQATEQKLQALQAQLQSLEAEAERLRQPGKRTAAGAAAIPTNNANLGASADANGFNWMPLLAGVLAVAMLVIGWLVVRMKRIQHNNALWEWEDNVAAVDEGIDDTGMTHADATPADADPFASLTSGPGRHATVHMGSQAAAPQAASAAAQSARSGKQATGGSWSNPATTTTRHGMPAAPFAPAAHPFDQVAAGATAAAAATSAAAAFTTPAAHAPVTPPASAAVAPPARAYQPAPRFGADAPLEFKLDEPAIALPDLNPQPAASAAGDDAAGTAGVDDLQFTSAKNQPAVEEISDAMQEAEFWISLHDSQRAVEVLEPYATADQPGSPLPWLYLFDLYRELGQRSKYDRLHERFHRIFNGKIASWTELDQTPAATPQRSLEDMPHVAQKIATLWQSEQIVPYLESLLLDDRDGNRVGFDLSVYREIMFLIGMAYELQQSKKFIKPAIGTPGWTLAA